MIKIVAVGVIGLVGMGAVAALGRNPAPSPRTEVAAEMIYYPEVVPANKSDRLPLKAQHDTAEHDTAEAASRVDDPPPVTMPAQIAIAQPPPSLPKVERAPAKIISRHWHDPADSKFKPRKRSAIASTAAHTLPSGKPKQAAEVKNCSQTGVDTFLRSINLKPRCDL